MSDSISLKGREYAEKLSSAPALDAYTGVSILVGQDQDGDPVYYNAGNDTGSVLEFENPWGTQAMANEILSKIQGKSYQPLEMRKTIVDPAVELGDMLDLTDEGISAMVLDRAIDFGAGMVNDISAPYSQEIDHEYQYTPSEERMLNRKIATTVASIRVDVDAIQLEVSGKIDSSQATSLIQQTMNNITLSVSSGTQSNTTKFTLSGTGISAVSDNITLKANSINLNTATISGKLTASNINANNITATGVNITGTINANAGTIKNADIEQSCHLMSDVSSGIAYSPIGVETTISGTTYGARLLAAKNGSYMTTGFRSDSPTSAMEFDVSNDEIIINSFSSNYSTNYWFKFDPTGFYYSANYGTSWTKIVP